MAITQGKVRVPIMRTDVRPAESLLSRGSERGTHWLAEAIGCGGHGANRPLMRP